MFVIHSMNEQARFEDVLRNVEVDDEVLEIMQDGGLPEKKGWFIRRLPRRSRSVERTVNLVLGWLALLSAPIVR